MTDIPTQARTTTPEGLVLRVGDTDVLIDTALIVERGVNVNLHHSHGHDGKTWTTTVRLDNGQLCTRRAATLEGAVAHAKALAGALADYRAATSTAEQQLATALNAQG